MWFDHSTRILGLMGSLSTREHPGDRPQVFCDLFASRSDCLCFLSNWLKKPRDCPQVGYSTPAIARSSTSRTKTSKPRWRRSRRSTRSWNRKQPTWRENRFQSGRKSETEIKQADRDHRLEQAKEFQKQAESIRQKIKENTRSHEPLVKRRE